MSLVYVRASAADAASGDLAKATLVDLAPSPAAFQLIRLPRPDKKHGGRGIADVINRLALRIFNVDPKYAPLILHYKVQEQFNLGMPFPFWMSSLQASFTCALPFVLCFEIRFHFERFSRHMNN